MMNKRYMDFVPVKKTPEVAGGASGATSGVVRKSAATSGARAKVPTTEVNGMRRARMKVPATPVEPEVDEFVVNEIFEAKEVAVPAGVTVSERTLEAKDEVKFGVIEDLGPRFVKTEVPKRPLSGGKKAEAKEVDEKDEELKNAKAEKLVGRSALTGKKVSVGEGAMTRLGAKATKGKKEKKPADTPETAEGDSDTYKTPKFVNTEKVKKRPLSKNVYQKEVKAPVEEPKGPVTIIAKPEKDSKLGMVIAVIITIILGATAGTVAFLLLPK